MSIWQGTTAIPWLENVRAAGARNNELFFELGNSYLQAHQISKGRTAFADLYGVAPESGAARLITAHMLMRLELEDDAQAELEAALAREPIPALPWPVTTDWATPTRGARIGDMPSPRCNAPYRFWPLRSVARFVKTSTCSGFDLHQAPQHLLRFILLAGGIQFQPEVVPGLKVKRIDGHRIPVLRHGLLVTFLPSLTFALRGFRGG